MRGVDNNKFFLIFNYTLGETLVHLEKVCKHKFVLENSMLTTPKS